MAATRLPGVIWLLMALQALSMSIAPLFFFSGGIAGNVLAPRPALATLPVAMVIVGTALSVVPLTRLMHSFGRKAVFLGGATCCTGGALLAALALQRADFGLFCLAGLLTGASIAVAAQYRFAAIEAVGPDQVGPATSRVLLGGLVSAYLGPELVVWGERAAPWLPGGVQHSEHAAFIGGFALMALLGLLVIAILAIGYRNRATVEEGSHGEGRPLREIFRQRPLWLAVTAAAMGYAMMSFMMTATPLNMHSVDGHGLLDTKWVIQSHIIAMFAPSFFSGWLISRLGQRRVIVAGVLVYLACIAIALSGRELLHYWWALVLLGIGWNFLFVGGTSLLPLCHRPTERFKVQTLNEFAVFGTQSLAALSSGWVVNTWGWEVLVLLSSLMVCAILLALWLSASGVRETRAA
jgi:predicted MFS family arabinose efflux permease